ncbi:MAG: methyltransferase domain-containing protein [Candidatus Aminicenantales bacterium]
MNPADKMVVLPSLIVDNIDIFVCPACGGDLAITEDHLRMGCSSCHRTFESENGIPLLFWLNEEDTSDEVTIDVRSFYEKNPFPGYEDIDSPSHLREKAERGVFARLLDEQVPPFSKILEVGCGTGQLSNFLGMTWGRTVFATDISLNSLKLGHQFKQQNEIHYVAFLQMNLFHPVFRPGSFDLVICNGVLHHTKDPFLGFRSILRLVRQDGFIIVGLYNTYGRILTDIRRFIFKISGRRFKFLDPRLREEDLSERRKEIWFRDQYENPQESKHTIGEVLGWFDRCGVEYTNSIPKSKAFETFSPQEKLFETHPRVTRLDRFIVQSSMLLSGGKEGGFFIMIGRKTY